MKEKERILKKRREMRKKKEEEKAKREAEERARRKEPPSSDDEETSTGGPSVNSTSESESETDPAEETPIFKHTGSGKTTKKAAEAAEKKKAAEAAEKKKAAEAAEKKKATTASEAATPTTSRQWGDKAGPFRLPDGTEVGVEDITENANRMNLNGQEANEGQEAEFRKIQLEMLTDTDMELPTLTNKEEDNLLNGDNGK